MENEFVKERANGEVRDEEDVWRLCWLRLENRLSVPSFVSPFEFIIQIALSLLLRTLARRA